MGDITVARSPKAGTPDTPAAAAAAGSAGSAGSVGSAGLARDLAVTALILGVAGFAWFGWGRAAPPAGWSIPLAMGSGAAAYLHRASRVAAATKPDRVS